MKKYDSFKDYMYENYGDLIIQKLRSYAIRHKDDFESDEIYQVTYVEPDDISITGVTFKDIGNRELEIRVSFDAEIEVKGRGRYGYDSFPETKCYNIFFIGILEDGLQQMRVTSLVEYEKNHYEKDKSLSQDLVPYMYEEDVEKHAEDFLERHYKKALLQPMPLPVEEIAKEMGMEIYFAPLDENIFGKTYFGEEFVTVYENILGGKKMEIRTKPGTMLINPNVYFMYNIGTANNTIIHECVHWDRHRRAFELQRLLEGGSNYISCEIVESYEGIPEDSSALKWMEWQANQLAPRILMPANMTKRVLSDLLIAEYNEHPKERFAVHMETAINKLSLYFQVSNIAAKIRAIELGFDRAQGVQIFCNGKYMPPFSFAKGALTRNQTFVVDEKNLLFNLMMHPNLGRLFAEGKIVYANCMLCLNTDKYICANENGQPILTDYALEHVDECCFIFDRKYSASNAYSDTFYRRCFLCSDISARGFVEADYDEHHKSNQSKIEREKELSKICDFTDKMVDFMEVLPGGFNKTLRAHMNRLDVNEEELSYRSNISTVTLSKYLNHNDAEKKIENVLAVGKALCLNPIYMEDLLRKAGLLSFFDKNDRAAIIVRYLIWNHPDESIDEWQKTLDDAHVNIQLPKKKIKK